MSGVVQVAGRQGMVVFAFACESETAPAQTLEQFPLEPSPHFDSPSKPSLTQLSINAAGTPEIGQSHTDCMHNPSSFCPILIPIYPV
jgi:hypothetical protein